MRTKHAVHQFPKFSVLSKNQCREIYHAALECVSRIGVKVYNDEGRALLAEAGAEVDGKLVKIPPHIIQQSLMWTPKSFRLWDRERTKSLLVSPNRVYFGPGPTCTYFNDPETGERRKARRGDAGLAALVSDALENIDFVMSLSLYDDVAPVLSPVYEFADMITNTSKPIAAWANDIDTITAIYKIATAVAGGEKNFRQKPNFLFFSAYQSPLQHPDEKIELALWAAEHHIPVVYLGGPTVGLESPITSASGLVIYLAAALSGLAMIQLKKPGAPVAIGGIPMVMDMFTARPAYGAPEMCLNTAAASELARYLDLPFMGTAGTSDSKVLDAQAGMEVMAQVLFSAFSGAGLVHDIGFLDCADIGSLDLLVLVDEVIGYTKRIMRGIRVNQETIMMELIEKIGPGGYFVAEPESVRLCREEVWVPKLSDRKPYVQWNAASGLSMEDRVHLRLESILSHYHPAELPQSVLDQIREILENEEKRVQK
jgi:trimethylamine--corrinoid protein Co-methyltransferase